MIQISCNNLSVSYENNLAVDNVSFDVKKGDYISIVGANGSGKSTIIKAMLGLVKPKSGDICFENGMKKTDVGYLPQQTMVQKDFPANVFEVVISGTLGKKGPIPFYSSKDKELANLNLKRLGIEHIKNKSYRDLSGGQQQRVLLARALCATDKLLVLDEPVTGLDPVAVSEFYTLIKKLNKEDKITILMISHDTKYAIQDANKIIHMGTKLMYFGEKDKYLSNEISKELLGRELC